MAADTYRKVLPRRAHGEGKPSAVTHPAHDALSSLINVRVDLLLRGRLFQLYISGCFRGKCRAAVETDLGKV